MNISKSILFAIIATVAPAAMHAAPMTATSLSVDGYNFGSFTCSLDKGGVLATPSSCNQISVSTITNPGVGIRFSSGFNAAYGSFDDAVITYKVSSNHGIDNVGLNFDGNFFGLAVTSVTEKVYDANGNAVGFAKVGCGADAGCTQTADVALNGTYNNLFIEKDINVAAAAYSGANLSIVDQTFADAPEPSSLALLGSGLLGSAALLRRKAKKA